MQVDNLIQSFSEFKDVKNIDRETMMNILERSYLLLIKNILKSYMKRLSLKRYVRLLSSTIHYLPKKL